MIEPSDLGYLIGTAILVLTVFIFLNNTPKGPTAA